MVVQRSSIFVPIAEQGDIDRLSSRRTNTKVIMINSILLAFINAGTITGSLIGSLIVGSPSADDEIGHELTNNTSTTDVNHVVDDWANITTGCPSASSKSHCGTDNCPYLVENIAAFVPSDHRLIYIAAAVSFAFNVVGLVISATLLPAPPGSLSSSGPCVIAAKRSCCRKQTGSERRSLETGATKESSVGGKATSSVRMRVVNTFRLMADYRLQLLIPSVALMGVIQSFAVGAFNQSFVGCLLGVNYIGYGTLCFRGSLITSSLLAGQLVSFVKRPTIILIAKFLMIVEVITWFLVPLPDYASSDDQQPASVGVRAMVLMWCTVNGVVYGLLRAALFGLFPCLFRSELSVALAHANIWEGLGTALSYLVNNWLCFDVKAYVLVGLTVISTITYVALECSICRAEAAQEQAREVRTGEDKPRFESEEEL